MGKDTNVYEHPAREGRACAPEHIEDTRTDSFESIGLAAWKILKRVNRERKNPDAAPIAPGSSVAREARKDESENAGEIIAAPRR